jgi:hypothetical protein
MLLQLNVSDFLFESGFASLVPYDVDGAVALDFPFEAISPFRLVVNDIRCSVPAYRGHYRLILSDLIIVRLSDNLRAAVPSYLFPKPLTITDDLERKDAVIILTLPSPTLFEVTFTGAQWPQVTSKSLRFFIDEVNINTPTDSRGKLTILGSLGDISSTLERGEKLCIMPL